MAGGIAPALRATRVPPVAALREGVPLPAGRRARLTTPLAGLFMILGLAGIVTGLFGGLKTTPTLTFLGLGVAVAAIALRAGSPLGDLLPDHASDRTAYAVAFVLMGLVALVSLTQVRRLPATAGAAVIERRTRGRREAA